MMRHQPKYRRGFHSDQSCAKIPPLGSMLYRPGVHGPRRRLPCPRPQAIRHRRRSRGRTDCRRRRVGESIRDKIAGSARPEPTGRTAWRAVVPADTARDLVAMNRTGLWLGPDAHLVHYPVTQGTAVNIVAIVNERWEKKGWSAAGDPGQIAERFRDWPAAARKLIAAPHSWQKFALLTVNPNAAWTDGRLALLGRRRRPRHAPVSRPRGGRCDRRRGRAR